MTSNYYVKPKELPDVLVDELMKVHEYHSLPEKNPSTDELKTVRSDTIGEAIEFTTGWVGKFFVAVCLPAIICAAFVDNISVGGAMLMLCPLSLVFTGVVYTLKYQREHNSRRKRLATDKRKAYEKAEKRLEDGLRYAEQRYKKQVVSEAETLANSMNSSLEAGQSAADKLNNDLVQAQAAIGSAQYHFRQGAIPPFWDEVDRAAKWLAQYTYDADALAKARDRYLVGLEHLREHEHNFPPQFPVQARLARDYANPTVIYENFNRAVYEAFRSPHFATNWEIRKTQKILAAGFRTLEDAVAGLGYSVRRSTQNIQAEIIVINRY